MSAKPPINFATKSIGAIGLLATGAFVYNQFDQTRLIRRQSTNKRETREELNHAVWRMTHSTGPHPYFNNIANTLRSPANWNWLKRPLEFATTWGGMILENLIPLGLAVVCGSFLLGKRPSDALNGTATILGGGVHYGLEGLRFLGKNLIKTPWAASSAIRGSIRTWATSSKEGRLTSAALLGILLCCGHTFAKVLSGQDIDDRTNRFYNK